MSLAISNPTLVINNIAIAVVPNSVVYTEGLGEQNVRVQSAGGGSVETVYSDNAETKLSTVKFSMYNTAENIELIRSWKTNTNQNAISITATEFSRSFSSCALVNDYENNLGAETQIDLEFKGKAAI